MEEGGRGAEDGEGVVDNVGEGGDVDLVTALAAEVDGGEGGGGPGRGRARGGAVGCCYCPGVGRGRGGGGGGLFFKVFYIALPAKHSVAFFYIFAFSSPLAMLCPEHRGINAATSIGGSGFLTIRALTIP